jgi:hypothetical protein
VIPVSITIAAHTVVADSELSVAGDPVGSIQKYVTGFTF